ncbi:hypothetical protein F5879DRAFT_954301 [Lentinula edodes]|nr:hypothetical protein HHX47_DHR4000009 [Lentinula edodes]KAJ3904598.1 hypothetical protein F5879DRAFT_954301 [Lentinula edodes]KAJ3913195.1 hypothetical protein F5877DRAFT_84035 [Lentinula edodes]
MFFHKVSSFSSASTLVLLLAFTNTADALALPPTAVLKRASGIDAIAQPAANARSLPFIIRDVWSPNITSPDSSTVWKVNDHADVTWITTGAPAQITNPNGTILLGHMSDNGSENLDLQHPLASYVNLTLGKATIEVPDVPTGRYIIVLMGDSGNRSPEFMIQSGSGGAASNNSSDTSSTPTDSSSDSASDPPNTDAA